MAVPAAVLPNLHHSSPSGMVPARTSESSAEGLSNERELSTIPSRKGLWAYPSEKQFYRAIQTKGHQISPADMNIVVAVHNIVNEVAWEKILKFESLHSSECSEPKLIHFVGHPDRLTIRARMKSFLGYVEPFDTHEWTVDRCGKEVKYLIDYYEGTGRPLTGRPIAIHLDVRPMLSLAGIVDIFRLQWIQFKEKYLVPSSISQNNKTILTS